MPNAFAGRFVGRALDETGPEGLEQSLELIDFGNDRGRAAIDFNDQMRVALGKNLGTKAFARGSEREGIGDFKRRGQVPSVENRLDGGGGQGELGKNRGQHRASRRFGDQPQRGFGDDAQHAL